ncbi:MAG: helix-turn-helix domain-containing protein [Sphingomonas adhaesiva]
MSDQRFLTPAEVADRYRGEISVGTLRNWRSARVGPGFVKIGKAVLYPVDQLDAWDEKNLVSCRASNRLSEIGRDRQ